MFHSVALFISVEVSWIWKSISTADGRPESVSDLVFRFWLPSDVLWAVSIRCSMNLERELAQESTRVASRVLTPRRSHIHNFQMPLSIRRFIPHMNCHEFMPIISLFRIVVSPGAHNDTLSARWRDKNHLQVSSTTESGAHLYFYMLNFIDARRTVFLRDVKANDDRIVEVGRRGDRHLTAAADHRALANALLRNVDPVFGHLGHSPSVHQSIAISMRVLPSCSICQPSWVLHVSRIKKIICL